MKEQFWVAIFFLLLIGAGPQDDKGAVKAEIALLQGRWVTVSQEYGGEVYVPKSNEEKQTWHFEGDRLTRYENSKKLDVVQWVVRPGEIPKQIDFVPIKGMPPGPDGFVILTKGIYSVENDELKVATTFDFLPMTPEEERRQAEIKFAGIRPKSFVTKDGGVAVLTFKRAKKEAR